jgi:hypothetical protein
MYYQGALGLSQVVPYNPYVRPAALTQSMVIPTCNRKNPMVLDSVAPVVQPSAPATIKGESRVEYVPYERDVIEYEEE